MHLTTAPRHPPPFLCLLCFLLDFDEGALTAPRATLSRCEPPELESPPVSYTLNHGSASIPLSPRPCSLYRKRSLGLTRLGFLRVQGGAILTRPRTRSHLRPVNNSTDDLIRHLFTERHWRLRFESLLSWDTSAACWCPTPAARMQFLTSICRRASKPALPSRHP
jgi:hypothetical protein